MIYTYSQHVLHFRPRLQEIFRKVGREKEQERIREMPESARPRSLPLLSGDTLKKCLFCVMYLRPNDCTCYVTLCMIPVNCSWIWRSTPAEADLHGSDHF